MSSTPRRFPVALTVATAVALAILVGLGTWQVRRLAWKEDLLRRVEAARTGEPISYARALRAKDPSWARVRLTCRSFRAGRPLYGLTDGEIVWRLLALCDSAAGPTVVDRGVIDGSKGLVSPPETRFDGGATTVVGIVRKVSPPVAEVVADAGWPAQRWYVAAEAETPAPVGVKAAPLPTDIPNNHLGYALTWYGLAAALAGVYLALLRKRLKP